MSEEFDGRVERSGRWAGGMGQGRSTAERDYGSGCAGSTGLAEHRFGTDIKDFGQNGDPRRLNFECVLQRPSHRTIEPSSRS
jgi:hypothetical protein